MSGWHTLPSTLNFCSPICFLLDTLPYIMQPLWLPGPFVHSFPSWPLGLLGLPASPPQMASLSPPLSLGIVMSSLLYVISHPPTNEDYSMWCRTRQCEHWNNVCSLLGCHQHPISEMLKWQRLWHIGRLHPTHSYCWGHLCRISLSMCRQRLVWTW